MMKRIVLATSLFGLLLWLGVVCCSRSDDDKPGFELTILYTNDTHGHLLPYSLPNTFDADSPLALLSARHNIGGAARRATLVKRIRAEKNRRVLLIDAGDICGGSPFSVEYQGDADMAVLNAMRYDLACPGNHAFNTSYKQVNKLIASARFPYLCANVRKKAGGQLLYQPYVIKQIGPVKIAFFSLLTPSAQHYPAAKGKLIIDSAVATARNLIPRLRKQADLVVAVTHLGVQSDRELAVMVDGIDAIIGGHSHTLLPKTVFIGKVPWGKLPGVHGTLIEQDFQWAATLGRLDMTLQKTRAGAWVIQKYQSKLLPITDALPDDATVAAVVERYWKPIAKTYEKVIGRAAADFTLKAPDFAEYHLVADAVRQQMGTEFDLENMGGVRAPLVKGPITYRDLVTLDPFSRDKVVTFTITGQDLKKVLAQSQPAVSGIRYVIDAGKLVQASINGKAIDDNRNYRGSSNSYFLWTLSKYGAGNVKNTGEMRRLVVRRYIETQKVIRPAYDGRRVLKNMGPGLWHYNY